MVRSQSGITLEQRERLLRGPVRDAETLVETGGQPDGYREFLLALLDEEIAFAKPVAYVHGDSRYFSIEFLDLRAMRLENLAHIQTFVDNQANGNNEVHWLKVLINAQIRRFLYQ